MQNKNRELDRLNSVYKKLLDGAQVWERLPEQAPPPVQATPACCPLRLRPAAGSVAPGCCELQIPWEQRKE
jgi:hypothetical protein